MRRSAGTRRAVLGALATLCLLVGFSGANVHAGTPSPYATAAHRELPPANSPFRLGTAGRPFAWATAVGDLNADRRPDYAIADRIGRGAAGFRYSVELSV